MFEQRPVEVLLSYVGAIMIGAVLCIGVQLYGDWKSKQHNTQKG